MHYHTCMPCVMLIILQAAAEQSDAEAAARSAQKEYEAAAEMSRMTYDAAVTAEASAEQQKSLAARLQTERTALEDVLTEAIEVAKITKSKVCARACVCVCVLAVTMRSLSHCLPPLQPAPKLCQRLLGLSLAAFTLWLCVCVCMCVGRG